MAPEAPEMATTIVLMVVSLWPTAGVWPEVYHRAPAA
jgi:hypothetical protein